MALASKFAKIHTVNGYQVLMVGRRKLEGGERKYEIHTICDLMRYDMGASEFIVEFDGWMNQVQFDEWTTFNRAVLAMDDITKALEEQIKKTPIK